MSLFRGCSAHTVAEACRSVPQSHPSFRQNLIFSFLAVLCLSAAQPAAAETVDFTLPDIDGKQQKLSDYRGKWIVVNYWATWCPPCIAEIPELVEFHESHKNKDAIVIGVDFEEIDTDKLREFVDSYFMSYPILRMKPAPRSSLGLIEGLPTSFLISPDGKLVAQQTGQVTAALIEEFIAEQNGSQTGKPQKTKAPSVESNSAKPVGKAAVAKSDRLAPAALATPKNTP